ncbi:MAG: HAD family hydrolase [Gemmataceae bacterium]|nr:HAD family hydrolase [Gemmataceae bacterium]
MKSIRAVILDVDGTLVDSNDAHARAWVEALAEHDNEVPFEKVRGLIGMGGDKLLPRVAEIDAESPTGKRIGARRKVLFRERYLPHLTPTPGAKQLIERMRRSGLRLAVASSAKADELEPLLAICGAANLIEHTTSSDDADNSKPDPDIVAAALKKLSLPAAETIMLGDTPYDVEAANRAGVATIALRCGGWNDAELAGAIAVYADPADLLEHFDTSPLSVTPARC